jgi:hypothetical protein
MAYGRRLPAGLTRGNMRFRSGPSECFGLDKQANVQ